MLISAILWLAGGQAKVGQIKARCMHTTGRDKWSTWSYKLTFASLGYLNDLLAGEISGLMSLAFKNTPKIINCI